jgi:TrmH family RNA methyltransferase
MGLERVRVVLVRPQHAGNVGAAARAMKNMGLERLVLVAPQRWNQAQATTMAVHAADLLTCLRQVESLTEAIADCGLVVGTSGRATATQLGALPPRALVPEIVAASAANDVALVFGPEDHGLSNDDLAHCQRVVSIPTADAYGSLNLAQAVLVCAYELRLAAAPVGGATATAPTAVAGHGGGGTRTLAASERLELMYAKLETALRAIGFLHRDNATPMMRALRRTLGRAALDEQEAAVFLGLARQIAWAATACDKARVEDEASER